MMIFDNIVNNEKPPTIHRLLNSIVNFDKEEKTKIPDLAKEGRQTIFDFDYPLSEKVEREDFEVMILNRYMMRRIGYETLTAFKIALSVKLNEIMPVYNKMFDMLDGWDLFNDGEITTRNLSESGRSTNSNNETRQSTDNSTTNSTTNVDTRYAELPQNQLSDLQNGNYVTDYTRQNNTNNTTNNTTNNSTVNGSGTGTQNNTIEETVTKTPADKLKLYNDFIENRNHIYSMIFKELNCLFYGIY